VFGSRSLALALSATLFAAPVMALAQSASPAPQSTGQPQSQATGQPQPSASGQPAPSATGQSQSQPRSTTSGQPQPTSGQPQPTTGQPQSTTGQPPATTGQPQSTTGGQPASGSGANFSGAGLPPPPVPAVLPPVPPIPGYSAPVDAVPNGDLVGVQNQPFVGLALQDAIGMSLQRNTDLALAQSNRRITTYQIVAAKGAYDVNFQVIPSFQHMVEPVSSPFNTTADGGPVTQDELGVTTGVSGLTGTGGKYNIGINAQRYTNDSAYNSFNPYYETALQFSITQPLARGLAIDQPRLQIQLAKLNNQIAASNALLQASNTVVQVSDAYYDLVAAWQNVAIQEEGLREATAQAESNTRLARHGAVAPTDIVEANTQVNVFQDNVFAAIQNVQRAQIQLKELLLANPADPLWFANLVPTTSVAQVPAEPSLSALVTSAIQNRPEIAQLRAQRGESDVNLAYAKDQLKPQVDVGLGYTSNGFAGNPLNPLANPLFGLLGSLVPPAELAEFPAPPGYENGNIGTSFKTALENRFPVYQGQLTVTIPIGNHTAKADYAIQQEQQRQVQLNETAVLQRVRGEAVNAIQGLREAQYRVIAARAARMAAQRVLIGEQRRFAAGTSTTFLVLQRQLQLAQDEGLELQAQTDLDKASVELERVSGGIFAQNNVDVDTVGKPTLDAAGPTSVLPAPSPTATAPPVRGLPH
jgi:HAE1 family hydrophobic/amphiphilic exporter-1